MSSFERRREFEQAAKESPLLASTVRRHGVACDHPNDCRGDVDFIRASGDVACRICGRAYRDHPFCAQSYSSFAEQLVLHVLCDGLHVKL
jgi:hypothetical protein